MAQRRDRKPSTRGGSGRLGSEHEIVEIGLDPTPHQATLLERATEARAWAWRWLRKARLDSFQETERSLGWKELSSLLTVEKNRRGKEWLREAPSQALQQALLELRAAYRAFFAGRAGFPPPKPIGQSFRLPQGVTILPDTVRIPKIGEVRIQGVPRIPRGTVKSVTVRFIDGRWSASVSVLRSAGTAIADRAPRSSRHKGQAAGSRRRTIRGTPANALKEARGLRREPTPAHRALWESLRMRRVLGFKFRRRHPLPCGRIIDFWCPEVRYGVHLGNPPVGSPGSVVAVSAERVIVDLDGVVREIEAGLRAAR
jgi:hypothetical protein